MNKLRMYFWIRRIPVPEPENIRYFPHGTFILPCIRKAPLPSSHGAQENRILDTIMTSLILDIALGTRMRSATMTTMMLIVVVIVAEQIANIRTTIAGILIAAIQGSVLIKRLQDFL